MPGCNASRFSVSLVIIYEVTTLKFECDKSLLSAAIDGVSRAITNRAAIPVLEGIYLKAEGFQLTLTGYDMEMGITTNIECNVQVPGETVQNT
jgi:DNA polymerase III subunit beta